MALVKKDLLYIKHHDTYWLEKTESSHTEFEKVIELIKNL